MKDKELSASDDIIQLRPQQIHFQLRVGEYGRPRKHTKMLNAVFKLFMF